MAAYETYTRNTFRPIKENLLILDFTSCRTLGEVHGILKEKFRLPVYYGENWNVLWDCLDGLFWNKEPFAVEIYGCFSLEETLSTACATMPEVFDDVHKNSPHVVFQLVS